jgi:hypothetical protein
MTRYHVFLALGLAIFVLGVVLRLSTNPATWYFGDVVLAAGFAMTLWAWGTRRRAERRTR